ncbi:MAG: glycosyltransferase [Coraliomargaritaceae bacterium]
MYDAVPSRRRIEKWWQIRNFQIISFSRLLHKELKALGLSSHNIKYYPKPSKEIIYGDPYSAFFWHRHDSISSNDAELICKNLNLKHLHIHRASDPGHEANHENKFGEIRKTYSDWFKSQDEFRALISKSAYFIAPRNKEGIGMAYLEAMGQGKCVIAKNNSTMNEYIKNKENGILYGNKFKKSDINLKEIQQNAYISSLKGHEKWKKEKELILKYIKADTKTNKLRLYLMVIIGLTTNPGRVIKALLNK